jgi:hypothetical protein
MRSKVRAREDSKINKKEKKGDNKIKKNLKECDYI